MSLATRMKKLARLVPGVAGYQDREHLRDTDHQVRLRLGTRVGELQRNLEAVQRRLTEAHELAPLAALGRLGARLDEVAARLRYAPRGYGGFFAERPPAKETLGQVYDFDLSLFAALDDVAERIGALDTDTAGAALTQADAAVTNFMTTLEQRKGILHGEG